MVRGEDSQKDRDQGKIVNTIFFFLHYTTGGDILKERKPMVKSSRELQGWDCTVEIQKYFTEREGRKGGKEGKKEGGREIGKVGGREGRKERRTKLKVVNDLGIPYGACTFILLPSGTSIWFRAV